MPESVACAFDDSDDEVFSTRAISAGAVAREEAKESKPGVLARVASMIGLGSKGASRDAGPSAPSSASAPAKAEAKERVAEKAARIDDPATIMARQLASGLWSERDDRSAVRETALALWSLSRASVNTTHPMYGTPVKKAVEALLERVKKLGVSDAALASFALGVAWLIATGRRTRADIEAVASAVPACAGKLSGDEAATRAWVEGMAASV
jgi:hypothetical protein